MLSSGHLPRHHNFAPSRLLDSGEPLWASMQQVGFAEDLWRPVEVNVYLKLPGGTYAGNLG